MLKTVLSIEEAADFIGTGRQSLRVGLQNKIFPFGVAIPKQGKSGKTTYKYNIQRVQVERYVGMSYKKFLESKEEK